MPKATLGFDEQQLREIRALYIVQGWSVDKLAATLQHSPKKISTLIRLNKWDRIRDRIDDAIIRKGLINHQTKFESIVGLSSELIRKFLVSANRNFDELSPDFKDIKLTSDILANAHRVLQITKGEPTDIIKNIKQLSDKEVIEQAMAVIKSFKTDPMIELEVLALPEGDGAPQGPTIVEFDPMTKDESIN